MRNSTCIICGTEFEPRKSKLYCGNACKQKGYSDKKYRQIESIAKEQEIKVEKTQMLSYYQEYLDYNDEYPSEKPSTFLLFCFLRKNISGALSNSLDRNRFYNYVLILDDSFWYDLYENKNSAIARRYEEFKAKYFGDDFLISFPSQAV
jgi:hypothetical protein